MRLFIPYLGPSTNAIYAGIHWTKRKEAKDDAAVAVEAAINKADIGMPISSRVDLVFTPQLGKGARKRDTSNNSMTAKLIEDALVKAGVLKDDTEQYVRNVTLCPAQVDRSADTGMWVELIPVEVAA
ncbi:hypothetical protein ELY33_17105 [Vreelandella andesensis]|uniref:Uncharacterized protein n=1 Tax=Vreelandella andesensis TaxID=447567 RepID=A0A3S0W369_9GAMM|nr:hypothetical protein [Halomonas andesensis]RUR26826.1 hypothetical protein ELY33_17105 [Halomonas andesensis]